MHHIYENFDKEILAQIQVIWKMPPDLRVMAVNFSNITKKEYQQTMSQIYLLPEVRFLR